MKKWLANKDLYICVNLFLIGIITRLPFLEQITSHTDATSFIIAVTNYDLSQETPAPPGYPFYYALGKFFNIFLNNPYDALLTVSVLASGACAFIFYITGKSFGGRKVGLISSVFFLSASTFYYLGITVYAYLLSIGMWALLIFCVNEILFKNKKYGYLLGLIFAVQIGIRPQDLIFTLPLFLLGVFYLQKNEKVKAVSTFILLTLAWIIPYLQYVGGLSKYLSISSRAAETALPLPTFTVFITKKFEIASNLYLTIGLGMIILLIFMISSLLRWHEIKKQKLFFRKIIFIFVWVGPVLFFNLFVRTEHIGYQAGYLIFLLFGVAYAIPKLFKSNLAIFIATGAIVVSNLYIFFQDRDPSYLYSYRQSSFHYTDIKRNEFEIKNKVNFIKQNYSPDEVLIIAGPYFWRHARFYLPEYTVISVDLQNIKTDSNENKYTYAKNLKFENRNMKNSSLVIHKGVKYIVLFDNESDGWFDGNEKLVKFKGIVKMVTIDVNGNEKLLFEPGRILKEENK